MKPHAHSFHELICVMRGRMHVAGAGRVLDAAAGDVLLYPANVAHEEWTDAAAPVESVFFGFTCPLDADSGIVAARDPRGRIGEMACWVYADLRAGRSACRIGHQALLTAILAEFASSLTEPTHAWVEQVRGHIRKHLAERLTLDALARVAGLSRFHFARAFKRATGETPLQAVRAIRLQHARQLILGTSLPLKAIAEQSGLGNVYSLSRAFRQCLDIPPGKLRRFHTR